MTLKKKIMITISFFLLIIGIISINSENNGLDSEIKAAKDIQASGTSMPKRKSVRI